MNWSTFIVILFQKLMCLYSIYHAWIELTRQHWNPCRRRWREHVSSWSFLNLLLWPSRQHSKCLITYTSASDSGKTCLVFHCSCILWSVPGPQKIWNKKLDDEKLSVLYRHWFFFLNRNWTTEIILLSISQTHCSFSLWYIASMIIAFFHCWIFRSNNFHNATINKKPWDVWDMFSHKVPSKIIGIVQLWQLHCCKIGLI